MIDAAHAVHKVDNASYLLYHALNRCIGEFLRAMILFLIVIDLILMSFVGAVYAFVAAEARRGRDVVLELTNYKHLAEDMLPVLRMMLLYAMLFFACLFSMLVGQTWISQSAR